MIHIALTIRQKITNTISHALSAFDLIFIFPALPYHIPLSPSLREMKFAISRKNTPTIDWKRPTAVVSEN
jgi:hypothetical protein